MERTPVGTRSLNETMDRNGLTWTKALELDVNDDDIDDDDEVLNSWRRKLPVTTSSTCHQVDCDTLSWCSVSITELQSSPASSSQSSLANILFFIFIDRVAEAIIHLVASMCVRPCVCPSVCLRALSCLNRLTFDLDFWHESRPWPWLAWDCRSRS